MSEVRLIAHGVSFSGSASKERSDGVDGHFFIKYHQFSELASGLAVIIQFENQNREGLISEFYYVAPAEDDEVVVFIKADYSIPCGNRFSRLAKLVRS